MWKIVKDNAITLLLFVLLLNYGFVHFCVIPGEVAAAALQDYGFISVLTIFCILSAELLAVWGGTQSQCTRDRIDHFSLAYVLQIYLCREADMHHFFTDGSVAGIRYFKNFENPILPKLIAGPILILFIICFAYILLRYSLFTLKAFFRGEAWAVAVAFWGTLLVGSQIYDKIDFPDDPWRIKLLEEYAEFSASAYLPTAILLYKYFPRKNKETKLPDSKCGESFFARFMAFINAE